MRNSLLNSKAISVRNLIKNRKLLQGLINSKNRSGNKYSGYRFSLLIGNDTCRITVQRLARQSYSAVFRTKEMNIRRLILLGILAFQNRPHCLHPLRAAAARLPISAVMFPFAFRYGPSRRASEQATPPSRLFLSAGPLVVTLAPSPLIAMTFAVLLCWC